MPMAPEDTRITSCPAFFTSLNTLHSASTRLMFMCPVGCASVDVPTFTTILTEYHLDAHNRRFPAGPKPFGRSTSF